MSWRKSWFGRDGDLGSNDLCSSVNDNIFFFSFSTDSITLALQTAARLSQQAELGGILEEIEVSL